MLNNERMYKNSWYTMGMNEFLYITFIFKQKITYKKGAKIVVGIPNISNINLMQKSLDALWLRQQTISNNIANIDTPNYKSKEVVFEDFLQNMLSTNSGTYDSEVENISPQVVENSNTIAREDGNNVDIDKENIEMYRAQIQYDYMIREITSSFSNAKLVLTEGKSI